MNPLSLDEIAEMCGGLASAQGGDVRVSRISKDTRTLERGDLYFALCGENFDGNKFAADALARGAAGAVLDDPAVAAELMPKLPVILVEDSLAALQRLAAEWRDHLKLKVIAVTGSNGKTSTKEFTAAVLSASFTTTKTQGNLNNHIGVPLSILAADICDEAAVWEIGMNHPGEVAPLARLVHPDVAIVSNIGVSHIEYMGSREAIAREKGALLAALPANGMAIFPDGDEFADTLESLTRARVLRVGGDKSSIRAENISVSASETKFTLWANGETHAVTLPVAGRHMVSNALCAIAAGLACGMEVSECVEGLARTEMVEGRLTPREIGGVCYLDDTYNANPDSMCAALETLKYMECGGLTPLSKGSEAPASCYMPPAKAWPEGFSQVKHFVSYDGLKNAPDYDAAKGGDRAAAVRLVNELLCGELQREQIRLLGEMHPDAILLPVHAEESTGKNKIPSTLAKYISTQTGLEATDSIVQSKKVERTKKNKWYRVAVRPTFDGTVQSGREYILVDDFVHGGGTLSELRRYVEGNGGIVVDMIAFFAVRPELALSSKTKLALEIKFGIESLEQFLREYKIYDGNHSALTESEARTLLGVGSLDEAGDRIAQARLARDVRLLRYCVHESPAIDGEGANLARDGSGTQGGIKVFAGDSKENGSLNRRIAVLGRMGELGTHAEEGYARVGRAAAQALDYLITVGEETETLARSAAEAGLANVQRVADTAEAADVLKKIVRAGDVVLVKGSRSAKMETLFTHLEKL